MNQSITYNDYKFDISDEQNSIKIQVFNNKTQEFYSGTVNENEIYVQPIGKFYKMLLSALNKEENFDMEITKSNDKLKCKILYKTEFIELEEIFSLDKVDNGKAVEYQLIEEIKTLKDDNIELKKLVTDLTIKLTLLLDETNDLKQKVKNLEENEVTFMKETGTSYGNTGYAYKPIPKNNANLIIDNSGWEVYQNNTVIYDYLKNGFDAIFNFNKITINNVESFNPTNGQGLLNIIKMILNKTQTINHIIVYNYPPQLKEFADILLKYSNYKKLSINNTMFKSHCKKNKIVFELLS